MTWLIVAGTVVMYLAIAVVVSSVFLASDYDSPESVFYGLIWPLAAVVAISTLFLSGFLAVCGFFGDRLAGTALVRRFK